MNIYNISRNKVLTLLCTVQQFIGFILISSRPHVEAINVNVFESGDADLQKMSCLSRPLNTNTTRQQALQVSKRNASMHP